VCENSFVHEREHVTFLAASRRPAAIEDHCSGGGIVSAWLSAIHRLDQLVIPLIAWRNLFCAQARNLEPFSFDSGRSDTPVATAGDVQASLVFEYAHIRHLEAFALACKGRLSYRARAISKNHVADVRACWPHLLFRLAYRHAGSCFALDTKPTRPLARAWTGSVPRHEP